MSQQVEMPGEKGGMNTPQTRNIGITHMEKSCFCGDVHLRVKRKPLQYNKEMGWHDIERVIDRAVFQLCPKCVKEHGSIMPICGETVWVLWWHYKPKSDDSGLPWNTMLGVCPTEDCARQCAADYMEMKPQRVVKFEPWQVSGI